MAEKKDFITSGIGHLDDLLGGGIIMGDNVIWYDDAGSLALLFCLNLVKASLNKNKSLIYVSFDRSPKNLLDKLGPLAKNPNLNILDCFSFGKGEGAEVFLNFYKDKSTPNACRIWKMDAPMTPERVMDAVYKLHNTMEEDVRLVFESLTGMQELWGEEDQILNFYSRSCPRLYELNTIAYWIVEKEVHSHKLKAHLNKITQVAIDLCLKRGKTSLTVLKAEKRDIHLLDKPAIYWHKGLDVYFESEKTTGSQWELGQRIKALRMMTGLSQTDLAKSVGVTPSTISQVENHQIYPSIPALIKMAEILNVNISSLFKDHLAEQAAVVFKESDWMTIQLPNIPQDTIHTQRLTPMAFDAKIEPCLIEFPPGIKLPSHFFSYKGEEAGYMISGTLDLHLENGVQKLQPGNWVHLTVQAPLSWENTGDEPAQLLWMKFH